MAALEDLVRGGRTREVGEMAGQLLLALRQMKYHDVTLIQRVESVLGDAKDRLQRFGDAPSPVSR